MNTVGSVLSVMHYNFLIFCFIHFSFSFSSQLVKKFLSSQTKSEDYAIVSVCFWFIYVFTFTLTGSGL